MKAKLIALSLSALLLLGLSGCGIRTMALPQEKAAITKEQAQETALKHAGFTAEQVKYLRTDYEIDDGIPQYEVRFHQGRWEYDYEIDARSGDIVSYDRDN